MCQRSAAASEGRTAKFRSGLTSLLASRCYTVLLAAFLLAVGIPFLAKGWTEWDDVYVAAAQRLLHGEDIYLANTNFTYPPFMAIAAIPFAVVGRFPGRIGWFLVNAVCVVIVFRSAWRLAGGPAMSNARSVAWREHAAFVLGAACGLRFLLNGLSHCQTDLLICALTFAACVAVIDRPSLAGAGFGLAAAIKGPPILWAGYLVYLRRFRAAACMLAVALAASLLPDLVNSPTDEGPWVRRWFRSCVAPLKEAGRYPGVWASSAEYNQSLAGAIHRASVVDYQTVDGKPVVVPRSLARWTPRQAKGVLYGVHTVVLGIVATAWWRRRLTRGANPRSTTVSNLALEASLVVLLMVLLSPMSSKPHFVVLILPGFCLARLALVEGSCLAAVCLTMAMFLVHSGWNIWGDRIEFLSLWYGTTTSATILMLIGCAALWARNGEIDAQGSSHWAQWKSARLAA